MNRLFTHLYGKQDDCSVFLPNAVGGSRVLKQFVVGAVSNLILLVLVIGLLHQPNVAAPQALSIPLPFEANHCFAIADELPNDKRQDTLLKINPAAMIAEEQVVEIGRTGTLDVETIMLGSNDVLYGVDRDRLVTLNTTSGTATRIGEPIGQIRGDDGSIEVKDVDGLAYNNKAANKRNQMIGVRRRNNEADVFFWVDIITGQPVLDEYALEQDYVRFGGGADMPLQDVDDLVFHPATGQLWGIANNRGVDSTLVTIDVATGVYEAVGRILGPDGKSLHDIEGITFWHHNNNWVLIGSTGENVKGNPFKNTIFEIQYSAPSAGTIAANKLFTFPDTWKDIEGLACPFEPDITPTPTTPTNTPTNTPTITNTPTNTPTPTPTPTPAFAAIDIEKYTHGPGQEAQDADSAPGPIIEPEMPVYWTYVVTNIGDVALRDVLVTDDKVATLFCNQQTLTVGESMTCVASGSASVGQYKNTGYVIGYPVDGGSPVSDSDPSHYFGARTAIELSKSPQMTWLYRVANPGELALSNIQFDVPNAVTVDCGEMDLLEPDGKIACKATGPESEYVKEVLVLAWTLDGTQQVTATVQATNQLLIEATNEQDSTSTKPIGAERQSTYLVRNSSNRPIHSLSGLIKPLGGDDDSDETINCKVTELAVGESTICHFTDVVDAVKKPQVAVFQAHEAGADHQGVRSEEVDVVLGHVLRGIGGRIYNDSASTNENVQVASPHKPGVSKAIIQLYDNLGNLLGDYETTDSGNYDFDQLVPGDYYLTFNHVFEDRRWTKANQGADDNLDSDAVDEWMTGPNARSHYFHLDAAGNFYNPTWDAGLLELQMQPQVYLPISLR